MNIVLSFDQAGESNATALFRLLMQDDQTGRHYYSTRRPEDIRAAVSAAYNYLVEQWQPGDDVYLFGAGSGGACAQALTRLLGAIGVLDGELRSYLLQTYALPRSARTAQDWQHLGEVAAGLAEHDHSTVPVRFLGLWDTARVRGTAGPVKVAAGRHAVAIDGGLTLQHAEGVDEVWFRGTHRDIVAGPLALDWMLDGAVRAGLRVGATASAHGAADSPAARGRCRTRQRADACAGPSAVLAAAAGPGAVERPGLAGPRRTSGVHHLGPAVAPADPGRRLLAMPGMTVYATTSEALLSEAQTDDR